MFLIRILVMNALILLGPVCIFEAIVRASHAHQPDIGNFIDVFAFRFTNHFRSLLSFFRSAFLAFRLRLKFVFVYDKTLMHSCADDFFFISGSDAEDDLAAVDCCDDSGRADLHALRRGGIMRGVHMDADRCLAFVQIRNKKL